MHHKQPDIHFFNELTDLNMDFLQLVACYPCHDAQSVLGLEPPIVDSLRRLDRDQLRSIAAAPRLLACFSSLPPEQLPGTIAESRPGPSAEELAWLETATVFAAGLMTYLWQLSKQDYCTASLCIGPTPPRIRDFAAMRFREIRHQATHSVRLLRAHLSDQPRVWFDLVRSARSADPEMQHLSRLKLIPLGLVGRRPVSPTQPVHTRARRGI